METIHYAFAKSLAFFEPSLAKMVVSASLTVLGFFFSELYTEGLIAVVMLMVIDTILGVCAAYHEGAVITSRRFSRSVVKGIVYLTAISAGHFADMTIPFSLIESTMIGFVATTEFVSILENVGRLGFQTPKKLLNQLQGKYL